MANKPKSAAYFVEEAFNRLGKDAASLHIMGGKFEDTCLSTFCDAWDKVSDGWFEWVMVEEVHQFEVKKEGKLGTAVPTTPFYLERLRLFGPKGDLELRRDGETFHWHFMGDVANQWLDLTTFEVKTHPAFVLPEVEERYYQWRKTDERVGGAWLAQVGSDDKNKKGMYLKQRHYLENGRIAFVRYVGFEEVGNG